MLVQGEVRLHAEFLEYDLHVPHRWALAAQLELGFVEDVEEQVGGPDDAPPLVVGCKTGRVSGMAAEMQTVGLLTGVSYVSGIDYYRQINEGVATALASPTDIAGGHSSKMLLYSADLEEYVTRLTDENWDDKVRALSSGGETLYCTTHPPTLQQPLAVSF